MTQPRSVELVGGPHDGSRLLCHEYAELGHTVCTPGVEGIQPACEYVVTKILHGVAFAYFRPAHTK